MINQSTLEKLEYKKVLLRISNYSITDPGKNLILNLLPMTDELDIVKECKAVSEAKEILIKNSPPKIDFLSNLNDALSKSKIAGSVLPAKTILEIYKLAASSRKLKSYLTDKKEDVSILSGSSIELFSDKVFEHHIEKIINENGEVKEKASKKLSEIRISIREKQSELEKSISRIMKNLDEKGMVREEYLTLRDGRMVIPIRAEHKRHLRGFVHSESASGQTVYIEPEETLELNNDIVSLYFSEKREIEKLLKDLTILIGKNSESLKNSLNTIAYVDSVFARAHHSIEVIGSFPQINNAKSFEVIDAKHPVLLKKLGNSNTVPLSFKLENRNIVVITGPNAGGKTVALKTIGLLSLLLQAGIHIPVNPDSNFHTFNKILVDIGDEQSIEDDLSTFSSHLMNIKNILAEAGENSLVLLDEIGTGTDPAEGSAIATAVLLKLNELNAIVFASTHHGNLKLIAHNEPGFVNGAMEFDHQKLTPTYKFKLGIPGSSYAFEIAKRIGVDENLIQIAENNMDKEKHKIENFLVDLESKSNAMEQKLKQLEIENARLSGLSTLYKKNLDELEREKKQILAKTKDDAKTYLSDVNKKIENVIKELRESNAKREVIKQSKKNVEEIKSINEKIIAETAFDIKEFEPKTGLFAKIKNTLTQGRIVSLDTGKNNAILQVGSVKMKVKINELEIGSKQEPEEKSFSVKSYKSAPLSYRIDIRGRKPDECEFEVIKYIDDAFMTGQQKVEILHGKGTGALKKMVKNILDNHDKVKIYYFSPIELGGDGITIVELK